MLLQVLYVLECFIESMCQQLKKERVMDNYGLWGTIVLILDVIAILSIIRSGYALVGKLIWTLVVLALPLVGMIAWFVFGEKRRIA